MDGEGSFSIVKTYQVVKAVDGTKSKKIRYHLHVKIANTNLPVLQWIVENFGGVVYTKKNWNSKWKQRYDWTMTKNSRIEVFILGILPYLQIKKEQAQVALDFSRLHGQEVPEERDRLRHIMLQLNDSSQPHSESLETNTQDTLKGSTEHIFGCACGFCKLGFTNVKIEPELAGDSESVPVVTQGSECELPPIGWWCSRSKGHDGPCAARLIQI